MHDSIKQLYDEHEIIVQAIGIAKQSSSLIGRDDIQYEDLVRNLIYFFRNYADQYHHHKEEEILFPEMEKKSEFLAEGVIKEMLDNHEDFRDMIRSVENHLDNKSFSEAQKQLVLYGEALLNHIAVENEEVFLMAESLFNDEELQKMKYRFEDGDQALGAERKTELVVLAGSFHKRLLNAG